MTTGVSVKRSAVLPLTPPSTIAGTSVQALNERSMLASKSTWTDQTESELREATGFSEDTVSDTPLDPPGGDSRTTATQPTRGDTVSATTPVSPSLRDTLEKTSFPPLLVLTQLVLLSLLPIIGTRV